MASMPERLYAGGKDIDQQQTVAYVLTAIIDHSEG